MNRRTMLGLAAIGGAGFRSAAIGGPGFRAAAIGGPGFRSAAFVGRGFHGGRFHHGFRRGFPLAAFAAGVGYGLYDPYYYDDYGYDPYYAAYQEDSYYDDSGCYIVQRRIHTRYRWRLRPVQVCN